MESPRTLEGICFSASRKRLVFKQASSACRNTTRNLHPWHKLDAHGHRHLDLGAGRFQRAGLRVDAEHYQAVAILIGDDEKGAGRINAEVSRGLDARALV